MWEEEEEEEDDDDDDEDEEDEEDEEEEEEEDYDGEEDEEDDEDEEDEEAEEEEEEEDDDDDDDEDEDDDDDDDEEEEDYDEEEDDEEEEDDDEEEDEEVDDDDDDDDDEDEEDFRVQTNIWEGINKNKGGCHQCWIISHGKYSVSFPWPPVVSAYDLTGLDEHRTAAEVSGSTKILIPRIQVCPSNPAIPFKMCRRWFLAKIAFRMAINKGQGQIQKYFQLSPVFSQWSALCGILRNIFIWQGHGSVTEEHR